MVKTTVYLEEETAVKLHQLSRERGQSRAAIIREALERYTDRAAARDLRRPEIRGIGAFQSGRADNAERVEEVLRKAARQNRLD